MNDLQIHDFHNFNVFFRDNPNYEVTAFTAAQLPNIANRIYPPELSGRLYPNGIPIYSEKKLPMLIRKHDVGLVVLAYSDLSYQEVIERASIVLANGADFWLLGPKSTMLKSKKPVIAVCATRTGAGKSTVSRKVAKILKNKGYKVGIVRHPMPYGILEKQICQRFESFQDLVDQECTIEEQEEYMQHIRNGFAVFAGVDYEKILKKAEKEFQIILWDGGNNDLPFYKPDLHIVVADPLRPGSELNSYPGSANVRMADVVIINKINIADPRNIETVENNIRKINPKAIIIKAKSVISVDNKELIRGKSTICIEDGPTITHGGLPYSVAFRAAERFGGKVIDPRQYAVGSIKKAYAEYPHMGKVLPALGYGKKQIKELEKTINNAKCDTVILGTPAPLEKLMKINKPCVRVSFELEETTKPNLDQILTKFLKSKGIN